MQFFFFVQKKIAQLKAVELVMQKHYKRQKTCASWHIGANTDQNDD